MVQFLPEYVRAPAFTPLPFGLMSVVQTPTDEDGIHWRNGIQFQQDPCDRAQTTIDRCPDNASGYNKPLTTDGLPTRGATSFTVFATLECAPVGYYAESESRLLAHFTNGEARAVERTFWTGFTDSPASGITYPHLAEDAEVISPDSVHPIILQTAATVITGTLDVVEGLAKLEAALAACSGGVGVIHAPYEVLEHFATNHLIKQSGQQMRTTAGTPVAFGAGYPGTGPDGSTPAAGTTWLYGTGPVMLRRESSPQITSTRAAGLNRSINDLTLRAERTYNLAWGCCHFAVLVSLGGIITGAPGEAGGEA